MKKTVRTIMCLLLVLLFALPVMAQAQETKDLEGFVLDDKYVMSGMDKSWYQGYEPVVSGGSVSICLPVTSKSSNGKLTATLIMDDEEIAPIRTQKRSAIFWRSEGMFSVKLSFTLSDSRVNGDYTGKVLLEGENKDGRYMFTEYPVVIRIRDGRDEIVHPEISEVSAQLNAGENGAISAVITNPSRYAEMTNLLLTVTDASGDVLPSGSDTLKLGSLKPNASIGISYPVSVKREASDAVHTLTFELSYSMAGKDGLWTETFTLPVSGKVGSDGNDEQIQPEIDEVSAELNVGEDGVICAKLTNTDSRAEMKNLLLTITDASGDVIPAGSDTLKLGSLKPDESIAIRYPVSVRPNAAVALHELTFNLTYTAGDNAGSWTETFTLPVSQQMRLEQGGVQMATTAVQGDIASITLPLMNMGRGDITNVMATLSIPGVVERQSVLVGTIMPGETKQAKLSFTPGKGVLGDVSGSITVAAEDAWGNSTSFSVPVELTVEEPVKLNPSGMVQKEEDKPPYLTYVFIGISALLLIALILQGMLLGAKIRKLEEDRL